jgi:transposase-like protein
MIRAARTSAGILHAVPNVKQTGQRIVQTLLWRTDPVFTAKLVARRFEVVFVSLTKGWWSCWRRGHGTSGAPKSRQAPEIATQKSGPLIAAAGVAALALRIF